MLVLWVWVLPVGPPAEEEEEGGGGGLVLGVVLDLEVVCDLVLCVFGGWLELELDVFGGVEGGGDDDEEDVDDEDVLGGELAVKAPLPLSPAMVPLAYWQHL